LKLPAKVDALVDLLDEAFPLRSHSVDTSMEAIQREYGKRDVVDFLRRLQAERDEDMGSHLLANAIIDNE